MERAASPLTSQVAGSEVVWRGVGPVQAIRRLCEAPLTWAVTSLAVATCAMLTTIGGDARWLAALGAAIVHTGTIPAGVPYASASSSEWHNVPVLGELIFHGLETVMGDRGLILAQVLAVAVALSVVATAIVTETRRTGVSMLVLLLVPVAAANAFLVVRAQLFSIALFPLLILLLRREARTPSRWIWLLVPLVVLWSNLHGAVLVGLAVAACYLLFDRFRTDPVVAIGVLLTTFAAGFVTPAGYETVRYYASVLGNPWASAHVGLWARASPHRFWDLLFVAAGLPLAVAAIRAKPRLWEWAAIAGLVLLVINSARNEVWLVLFLGPLAVHGFGRAGGRERPMPAVFAVSVVMATAVLVIGLVRPPTQIGAGPALRLEAIRLAHGTPILADPYLAEQLALQGATIVIGNPVDAFDPHDQRLYLEWTQGSPTAAKELAPTAHVVLVGRTTAAHKRLARDPAFCEADTDSRSTLYVRRPSASCD